MLATLSQFAWEFWRMLLEASPWLLLGLIVSGLLKAWLPSNLLARWLGGRGMRPVVNAAIFGTPLPLCSCSVIPAAVTLRRGGASKGATVSFLIATPENGADSIALSYALLGPFMTVVRPVAGVISAVVAGVLTDISAGGEATANESRPGAASETARGCQTADCGEAEKASAVAQTSCCSDAEHDRPGAAAESCGQGDASGGESHASCCEAAAAPASCCDEEKAESCCDGGATDDTQAGIWARTWGGMRFAVTTLFDEVAWWLIGGLVLAAAVSQFVPPETMAQWGSGILPMLAMIAIGVPLYICATASTPLAAAMLLAGVSPGTVLVFLLAGPATNAATLGIVRRELGNKALGSYLLGIAGSALALGLLTDYLAGALHINIAAETAGATRMVPWGLAVASVAVLAGLTIRLLATRVVAHMKSWWIAPQKIKDNVARTPVARRRAGQSVSSARS